MFLLSVLYDYKTSFREPKYKIKKAYFDTLLLE